MVLFITLKLTNSVKSAWTIKIQSKTAPVEFDKCGCFVYRVLFIIAFKEVVFYAVLFVCNYGVDIYIFNTAEDVAFNLRVDLFHLSYHIFDFLTL